MADKTLNARIVHKHDTETNWLKATNFIPKRGEIIVYDKDSNYSYERFKIGDGATNVNSLPFATDHIEDLIDTEIAAVTDLIGDTSVSDQITEAIANSGAVLYTEQTLTDEQRAQARINIGAIDEEDLPYKYAPILRQEHLYEGANYEKYNTYFSIDDLETNKYYFRSTFNGKTNSNRVIVVCDDNTEKQLFSRGLNEVVNMTVGDTTATFKFENSYIVADISDRSTADNITVTTHQNWNYLNTQNGYNEYIPTQNYHPATKKYVDDSVALKADQTALDEVSALVGDTAVSTQIENATEFPVVTAATSDGIAYTATVSQIASLAAGAKFIMIPGSVSTSTTPTLNVNGLGAKNFGRKLSNLSTVVPGYSAAWLSAGKPYIVMYDGTNWVVEGQNKPVAADLYGTVASATKATQDASGNVIVDTYATKTELTTVDDKWAGCWISFTDEDGNATTEPYIHWYEE